MSVTLTTSAAAACSDAAASIHGLRAACGLGRAGQFLSVRPAAASAVSHARLLFRPATLAGGSITLTGATDDLGHAQWSLRYDADARRLMLRSPHANDLDHDLLPAINWTCIEVRHDPVDLRLSWWIDGWPRGERTLADATAAAGQHWLGGIEKSHSLVGDYDLDEWVLADQYVGPALHPSPSSAAPDTLHADDPARWLVLYNTNQPDSLTWALHYRNARNLPYAHLLGLDCTADETISFAQYLDRLLDPLEDYLARHPRVTIMGVLLGYRMPGYALHPESGEALALGDLLHSSSRTPEVVGNPRGGPVLGPRPRFDESDGLRLTARIDAPTLTRALDLVDRATAWGGRDLVSTDRIMAQPDRRVIDAGGDAPFPTRLVNWAQGLDAQRLRSDLLLDLETSEQPADHPTSFYWGWGPPLVPTGFFGDAGPAAQDPSAGARVFSCQWRSADSAALTLREAVPQNWIDHALAAGYAAAAATTANYSETDLPHAGPFFEALRRGWTLAEAWMAGKALLRSGLYLVGDPLLTVRFPRAGWDLYGPLTRLDQLRPDHPVARLPAHNRDTRLPGTDAIAEGEVGMYVLRRVDSQGRVETGTTHVRLTRRGGVAGTPPPTPAWPTHDRWMPRLIDDGLAADLYLPRLPTDRELTAVQLLDDRDSPPRTVAVSRRQTVVRLHTELPVVPTRYRWRLLSADGSEHLSPWSLPIHREPSDLPPLSVLPLLENR